MLDYKVETLHNLEKELDKVVIEYNYYVFTRRDLVIERAQTDDDTIRYDEIRREIMKLDFKIYRCQEQIRDLTREVITLREEIYAKWQTFLIYDKGGHKASFIMKKIRRHSLLTFQIYNHQMK